MNNKDINNDILLIFQNLVSHAINALFDVRDYAKEMNLIHTQEYIDFEDKVNAFSVMDPRQ